MFKLSDIKAGYLLVVKDDYEIFNMTVVPNSEGVLGCCCPEKTWWPLACFGDNLDYCGNRIIKIYGCTQNACLLDNSESLRMLLWRRPEAVRLTHKEIEKKLGFPFEYVEE